MCAARLLSVPPYILTALSPGKPLMGGKSGGVGSLVSSLSPGTAPDAVGSGPGDNDFMR